MLSAVGGLRSLYIMESLMDFTTFKPDEMPADLWTTYGQLRDADPLKDNPQFDPHLVRLIATVRPDTRIVVASQANEPVAFWPMHMRPGKWARPLGGPFSDWHGPIIAPHAGICETDILEGAGLCGMTVHGFRSASLYDMPENLSVHGVHATDVSMGFENYLKHQKMLFPKHFKNIRRVTRNLEADFSSIEYNFNDDDPRALDWLIEKKRMQFQRTKRHDVLGAEWAQKYIDVLRHASGDRFGTKLMSLRLNGRIAAVELNLNSDRVMHGWLIAYDAEFGRYSPGYLLWHEGLKMMAEHGITEYDCGAGMEHYKKYYTNFMLPQGSGVLRTDRKSLSPSRIIGARWRAAEHIMPVRSREVMCKARRRMDQIAVSVTGRRARAKSLFGVIRQVGA